MSASRFAPSPATATAAAATPSIGARGFGEKLLDARLTAPVRVGRGERDVFEAPVRIHSGLDGISKALSQVEAPSASPASRAGRALQGARGLGKGLLLVGVALDAVDLRRSIGRDQARGDGQLDETRKAAGRIAGGWGGAFAGAAGGARLGALLPLGGPVAGMVIGSILGGVTGHIAGEKTFA